MASWSAEITGSWLSDENERCCAVVASRCYIMSMAFGIAIVFVYCASVFTEVLFYVQISKKCPQTSPACQTCDHGDDDRAFGHLHKTSRLPDNGNVARGDRFFPDRNRRYPLWTALVCRGLWRCGFYRCADLNGCQSLYPRLQDRFRSFDGYFLL